MRILITNNTLGARAGTEMYVRDLAFGLLARGHVPVCYSTELGEMAREIHEATIPVVDDLDMVGAPPDVIHGHHHLETMTALARFPDVPAVYVCHGWTPWPEVPPRFPRIRRYVAVSEACRDHVVLQRGIPEERVTILLNFVDFARFPPRGPLPATPARALLFSNAANEDGFVPVVRAACARAHLTLDVVGLANGNPLTDPGPLLGQYDLVFAKGKAALEAAVVGCAVVLCDQAGVGPMVTAAGLDRVRALNFGQRAMRHPIDPETLAGEIRRYSATDAGEVSRRLRLSAGHHAVIDALIDLYRDAIEEHAHRGCDREAEGRAAAAYLRWLAPSAKRGADEALFLRARLDALEKEHTALRHTLTFRARQRLLRLPFLGPAVASLVRTTGPPNQADERQQPARGSVPRR